MPVRSSAARQDAVAEARALLKRRPVFLDTETTDLGPGAEIVEICVLDHNGRTLVNTLVRPRGQIMPGAMWVHGITQAMVAEAPSWAEIWPEVSAALEGRVVAIYNAPFDLQMMRQSHARHRMRWHLPAEDAVCVMRLYARYHRSGRWQKLEAAAQQCGVDVPGAHRARADCRLARAVLRFMAEG